jgi:ABC-type transporter Mla MlaB component
LAEDPLIHPHFPQQTGIPRNSGQAATLSHILSAICEGLLDALEKAAPMTLKIESISGKRRTLIRLSGEVRAEYLDQLKAEIERAGPRVALDLDEVNRVDVEGVRFLNACVAQGISVLHCSPYIREWMWRERGAKKTH